MLYGFLPVSLLLKHPAKIIVRIKVAVIALGTNGLLKPGNCLLRPSLFQKIGADVIVGIAEIRIEANRFFTFPDCVIIQALKTVRPPQKRVRFRGRKGFNRFHVIFNRGFHPPRDLILIPPLKQIARCFFFIAVVFPG